MILDLQKFIESRQADWDEFEAMLDRLESGGRRLAMREARLFHLLYEKVASDLAKVRSSVVEPNTLSYLESLVSRGFSEMHGSSSRGVSPLRYLQNLVFGFPAAVRRHAPMLGISFLVFLLGGMFGAGALMLDPTSKPVLMPFPHLLGDPSERVAEEESGGRFSDDTKSTFSAYLMTHNTRVAILSFALGMTFAVGTGILLFYNGALIGAVAADYVLAGESVFLVGWLLPHGGIEIPALLIAAQGGLVLGRSLLPGEGRGALHERLRSVRTDLLLLMAGVALMLVWAGIIESFLSQYHEPVVPYAAKIAFGLVQLAAASAYFLLAGRGRMGGQDG